MPSYKLVYFNARGLAEVSRLLFALAGVPYEDIRYQVEEWGKQKANSKFGVLPELEIDGVKYTQSRAIMYYLAREFGYYPSNNTDCLKVDEVIFILEDLLNQSYKAFFVIDEKEKAEKQKEFREKEIPKYLERIEKVLKPAGGGYVVGDKVTVADVAVFDFMWGLEKHYAGCTDSFPLVKALVEKVGNLDRIKEWVEKRPDSQY